MSTLKRRIAQLFWPIGLFIALVVGCQKDTEVSTNQGSDDQYIDVNGQNVKVLLSKDTKNDFYILNTSLETEGIVLPVGTRIKTVKDDPSSFNFTLLEGYEMIFRGTTVQSANATAGKVTCTCSKGTGCSPFIADLKQNTTGCLMGPGCDECSKKTSARIAAPGGVIDETILEAGVVNLKNEIGFITEREELDKIRSISKLILS